MTAAIHRRYTPHHHNAAPIRPRISTSGGALSENQRNYEATIEVRRYEPETRSCMTCQSGFKSTGPHHRMCDRCRYVNTHDGGV